MRWQVWLLVATAIAVVAFTIYVTWFLFDCTGPNKFLIWGNTYKFGFTTYELQCYVGRFE